MTISPDILALVGRLNDELDQIEHQASKGLNLIRPALSRFPDNFSLTRLFVALNNILFFVSNYRERIQASINELQLMHDLPENVGEVGEDLSTMLGIVLEAKIRAEQIVAGLENLP